MSTSYWIPAFAGKTNILTIEYDKSFSQQLSGHCVLLLLMLLVVGCGQSTKLETSEERISKCPTAVVLDTIISGRILGQPLRAPSGLAIDKRGNVYLTDTGNSRLIRFDRDLIIQQDIGGHGSAPGLFKDPVFVTVDNDLNLLITDFGNRRICRHNARLQYVDEIGFRDIDDPLKFGMPSGVAVTRYGETWVCDTENHRIAIFDNIGRFDRFVGEFGYSGGELNYPQKIVSVPGDRFYVCDAGNSRVVIYDEQGNFDGDILSYTFESPHALVVRPDGLIWVLDDRTGQLACVDPTGDVLLTAGPLIPGCDKPLSNPSDLAFLTDGRLLISDTGNDRLLVCLVMFEDQ